MVDKIKPRRGSMGFRPRKRAATQNVRISWLPEGDKRVMGFAGYKAGMMHVAYTDQSESPTKGQEVVSAATVIETPPIIVYGIRCYDSTRSLGDILTTDEKLLKALNFKNKKTPKAIDEADMTDVRLLAFAEPNTTSIGKKHVESMEIGIGGKDAKEKMEYAKTMLGKPLRAKDVFKPGEFIDVIGVTKGKGWQGAVKRFGVAKQRRKSTNKVRHAGTLGQWHPAYVLYTIPQAGQTGYHTRTEMHKQVLKLGDSDKLNEVNPSSGFLNYGFVRNDYIILKGSIPGPAKRLIKLRLSSRPIPAQETQLTFVSIQPR